MRLKPAPGLVIRDPDLMDLLPKDGRDVPQSSYWLRRLQDGDVIEANDTAAVPDNNHPEEGDQQ